MTTTQTIILGVILGSVLYMLNRPPTPQDNTIRPSPDMAIPVHPGHVATLDESMRVLAVTVADQMGITDLEPIPDPRPWHEKLEFISPEYNDFFRADRAHFVMWLMDEVTGFTVDQVKCAWDQPQVQDDWVTIQRNRALQSFINQRLAIEAARATNGEAPRSMEFDQDATDWINNNLDDPYLFWDYVDSHNQSLGVAALVLDGPTIDQLDSPSGTAEMIAQLDGCQAVQMAAARLAETLERCSQ